MTTITNVPADTGLILEYGYGIVGDIDAQVTVTKSGVTLHWNRPEAPPTVAEIEAQRIPAYKAKRLIELRGAAAALILAKWPAWAQSNCALGIYPEATAAQCSADIAAVVTASNAAEDAVAAATTVAEVEAVTATWPTL